MAIKGFKQVIDKKGYRLDDKDRKIFEKEIKRGYFGFDVGDVIEFVIYDASDNQLPQESVQGKKVRYISYTDENIQKYFGKVPENKFNKKSNNAEEYFIDTEKLIKEAGYSNGVFKTQITFLNRRLGSEPRLFDKVWIHEISPSRTEVRVLPIIEDGKDIPNSDLQSRYDTFINCGTFTADVLIFIDDFIQQFDVAKVVKNMLMKKGTISDGENYIKLIEQEFKLVNFEVYLTQVKNVFTEIVDNYRMNRYYNPFESNFGKPTGDSFGVEFNIANTFDAICEMASNAAEFSLPNQTIRLNTYKTLEQQKTLDKVKEIVKTVRSNEEYSSSRPPTISAQIRGCMDPSAKNYNPNATVSSQCTYVVQEAKFNTIKICNDRNATNYGQEGACVYPAKCTDPNASNYGAYGECVYPKPQPPADPPPSVGTPTPTPSSTYSISASLIQSNPSPKNGRIIQEFRLSSSPTWPGSKNDHTIRITGAPDWCSITVQERKFSLPLLRVRVNKNEGAARSGTVSFSSSLPGNPTTSVTISQEGSSPTPPPPPPADPVDPPKPPAVPTLTTTPSTIGYNPAGIRVTGTAYITVTTTDTWTVSLGGNAASLVSLSTTSGNGNGRIDVIPTRVGGVAYGETQRLSGTITVRTSNGVVRTTNVYQDISSGRPDDLSDGVIDGGGRSFSGQGATETGSGRSTRNIL